MPHCKPGEAFSNNPNAPCLDPTNYVWEKSGFAALMAGAILYGVTVAMFFQSLRTLLSPTTGGRVMWGLVAHTVAMFLCLTIAVAIELSRLTSYGVDDRNGIHSPTSMGMFGPGEYAPGPDNWLALFILPYLVFFLNQWLADGLLLYRCYIIYAGNYLVVFPCLLYLATVATGAIYLYRTATDNAGSPKYIHSDYIVLPYTSICVALNILLTLMIIVRLVLHSRLIQRALGASVGATGVYTTIVVILTEACTPYAVAFLTYLVLPVHELNYISSIFVTRFQVIGPFLIIVRIAAGRAVTSNMTSAGADPICFKSQETSTGNSGTLADDNPTGSMTHEHGEAPGTPDIGREVGIEVPL